MAAVVPPYLSLGHVHYVIKVGDRAGPTVENKHILDIHIFGMGGGVVVGEWVPLHEIHGDRCVTYGMCSYIMNGSRCNSL